MQKVDQPLTRGRIRLEPLSTDHLCGLREAVRDGELWTLFFTMVPDPDAMAAHVATMLERRDAGLVLPFAVCDPDGTPFGMTTLMNIDWPNRRGEIGSTWYAASRQGGGTNTSAKLLLLELAFDRFDFVAVEFRTHWLNHRSRAAIERLGAKQDGILRNHVIMADGTLRDTVVYSVTATEWPAVRAHLTAREAARAQ